MLKNSFYIPFESKSIQRYCFQELFLCLNLLLHLVHLHFPSVARGRWRVLHPATDFPFKQHLCNSSWLLYRILQQSHLQSFTYGWRTCNQFFALEHLRQTLLCPFGANNSFFSEMVQRCSDGPKRVPNGQKHLGWR